MDSFNCDFNQILIWMRDTRNTLETDTDTIAWNTSKRYQRPIGMERFSACRAASQARLRRYVQW
jgi:hypothetical protein